MKINGIKIEGDLLKPNEDVLVLPRGQNKQVIFTARAVQTMEEFAKLCPEPKAPTAFVAGKGWIDQVEDKTYKSQCKEFGAKQLGYLIIKSLEDMDLEWDKISLDEPSTWGNWEKELLDNGFTQRECNLLVTLCMSVNQLDEAKLERARELFLLGRDQA